MSGQNSVTQSKRSVRRAPLSVAERSKRYRDRRRIAEAPLKVATELQDWVERAAATLPPMNADDIAAIAAIAARIDARIASKASADAAAS